MHVARFLKCVGPFDGKFLQKFLKISNLTTTILHTLVKSLTFLSCKSLSGILFAYFSADFERIHQEEEYVKDFRCYYYRLCDFKQAYDGERN